MGKAASFVCAIALAIIRIASGDTDISVCGSPPNIQGAITPQLKEMKHPLRTAVVYICPLGYSPLNVCNHISVCKMNKETGRADWTVPEITCNQPTCEELQPPKHGTVDLLGDVKVGSLAIYSCNPDRKLYGISTTKCLAPGKWAFDAPECLRSCKVPFIENGEMGRYETKYTRYRRRDGFKKVSAGENVDSRETLIFRCKNGALPVDNSQILKNNSLEVTCSDGTWSKDIQCKQNPEVCEPDEFRCNNGQCIAGSSKCDRKYDCTDGSDETTCSSPRCQPSEFTCDDGICVNAEGRCDGRNDCPDHSDERDCGCTPTQFQCNNKKCLDSRSHCDGIPDCDDGSDERDCPSGIFIEVYPERQTLRQGRAVIFRCRDTGVRRSRVEWIRADNHPLPPGSISRGGRLVIPNIQPEHSGVYICTSATASPRTSSAQKAAFLTVLPYEKDKSISSTEPAVTSVFRVTQPSVNVETSTHQTSDAKRIEDCFCKYEYEASLVKAQIGDRRLKIGDTIRLGEIVSFECTFVGAVLTWQNRLQLYGIAHMNCSTCKEWKLQDVPICRHYEENDALITTSVEGLNILPGGIVIVQKGKIYGFFCAGRLRYPKWDYGQRKGVYVTNFFPGSAYYVSYLNINAEEDELSGEYECYIRDNTGQRSGSAFLHLQVNENDSCPEFSNSPEVKVTYSNHLLVGSIATFECSLSKKYLIGKNSSICQENRSWSNPLPLCEDSKCSIRDLSMSVREGVMPDMSNVTEENVVIGSQLKLKCIETSMMTGDSMAVCKEHGIWKLGNFQCVQQCLLNLDPSSHLVVDPKKDGYRMGEFIFLSCPPGEEMSKKVERLMCMGGRWSDSLPECFDLEKKDQH